MSSDRSGDDTGTPLGSNKAWWALVLVAALAAVGSGLGKNVFEKAWAACCEPTPDNSIVLEVKRANSNSGFEGATAEILALHNQQQVELVDGKHSAATNRDGYAMLAPITASGVGYFLKVTIEDSNKLFAHTRPLEVGAAQTISISYPTDFGTGAFSLNSRQTPPQSPAEIVSQLPQSASAIPRWLSVAIAEVGQEEIEGPENNPRIMDYFAAVPSWSGSVSDDIPWSSAFLNFAFSEAGYKGTNTLVNKDWLKWGTPVNEPKLGCVAVFWRRSPSDWAGHAAFFLERNDNTFKVLGGNQHNSVSIMEIDASRYLGCRWPA